MQGLPVVARVPLGWVALCSLFAGCPAPPPLDRSGHYRCDTAADCPAGWFCRTLPPDGTDLRCHATPACTADDLSACDDGLSCTNDGCDAAAGNCTHVLAPATCVAGAACIDCSAMPLPPCGEAACEADTGACAVRPRTDGIACGEAVCAGRDAWQTAATCGGETTVCEAPPEPLPCPAGTCEVGRCAASAAGAACHTRVDPNPACSVAGTWWVVWTSTRPCDDTCGPVGGRLLIGGLGMLDVDAAGRGAWTPVAGGGQRAINLDTVGVDGRLRFASDLDVSWWGRVTASGDIVVASNPDEGGWWWMIRTEAARPALPADLAGEWHVYLTSVGFNMPWRIVGGRVTFDSAGCITGSEPADGLRQDDDHPFGPLPVAVGACATTTADGRLRVGLLEAGRGSNWFEGTLTPERGFGVFMYGDNLFHGPDTLVMARVLDEPVADLPPVAGEYAFIRNQIQRVAVRTEGESGASQAVLRTEFGGAIFDVRGDGDAWAWWSRGDGTFADATWTNTRARVLADGQYRFELLPEAGDGLLTDVVVVEPRGNWPAAPLLLGVPRGAGGQPARGALSVFVWVDDPDVAENPLVRPLVPPP